MQCCTIIQAQREVLRLSTSISVYATLTPTKVQAFYQCRLGALRYASTLSAIGLTTTFSGLSSGGFAVAPEKYATLHCQSRPKRRTKWQYCFMHIFLPLRLGGFAFAPLEKVQHCIVSYAPKGEQNDNASLCTYFSPP